VIARFTRRPMRRGLFIRGARYRVGNKSEFA
jgi:hypothetical protein